MSATSALERIERWAREHDPALPFALAEEVYELYQWHNGQGGG